MTDRTPTDAESTELKRMGIVRWRYGAPRGIRLGYGHGHGFAPWLPYRIQRLFVHPWNIAACRLYGHAWVPVADHDALTTCSCCSAKRAATLDEIGVRNWMDEKERQIREKWVREDRKSPS